MAKAWKTVIVLVVILLTLGVILAGAGLLTGASWSRVWTQLSGSLQVLNDQLREMERLTPRLPWL